MQVRDVLVDPRALLGRLGDGGRDAADLGLQLLGAFTGSRHVLVVPRTARPTRRVRPPAGGHAEVVVDRVLAEQSFDAGPAATRAARRSVRAALAGVAGEDVVDTAVLLASELVTNAALHVGGTVHLVVRARLGVVRLEVRDSGGRLPAPRRMLDRERTSGRGLHLVATLSDRWGAEPLAGGKVVWCELAV